MRIGRLASRPYLGERNQVAKFGTVSMVHGYGLDARDGECPSGVGAMLLSHRLPAHLNRPSPTYRDSAPSRIAP